MPAVLLVLTLIFACECCAQTKLILVKSRNKMTEYRQGDRIAIFLRSERMKISDQIRGFTEKTIVFNGYEVPLQLISHVYIDDKTINWYFLKFKYEKLLLFAGAGYLLLDVVNTGELSRETLIIGSAMVAGGVLARIFIKKRIRLGGRRMIRII